MISYFDGRCTSNFHTKEPSTYLDDIYNTVSACTDIGVTYRVPNSKLFGLEFSRHQTLDFPYTSQPDSTA